MGRFTRGVLVATLATAGLVATGPAARVAAATAPAISVGDASVVEGDSGARTLFFPVTLSQPAATTTTVRYQLAAGSASAGTTRIVGADFDPKRGTVKTLTFKAGTVAKAVGVNVFPDTVAEGDETFTIGLSSSSAGWSLERETGTGSIVDDDGAPKSGVRVGIGDVAIMEGDATKRAVKFAVALSAPATSEVRVGYTIVDGTADCGPVKNGIGVKPGTDCDSRKGVTRTLKFPVGRTGTTAVKKAVTVVVLPDTVDVTDETFTVLLSNPVGASLPDPTGTGTILDDDRAVAPSTTVLTSDVNPAAEGAQVTFTATVTAGSGTPTGTIEFSDGASPIGTATLAGGVATLGTDSLPAGVRSIVASYGGDAEFQSSVSDPLDQTIDPPLGPSAAVVGLASGDAHSCVRLDGGTLKCWGANSSGALGQGDTETRGDEPGELGDNLPAVDLGTGRTVAQVSAGNGFTCAILDGGRVKCWGEGSLGQLGQGDTEDRGDEPGEMGDALPAIALGAGRTATAVAAGGQHACALLDDASVKCWGEGTEGQLAQGSAAHLGDGPAEMGDALSAIDLGTGRTATAIVAGGWHTCAVLDDGSAKCWGWNPLGQLGLGDAAARGDGPGEMGDALPAVDLGSGRIATSIGAGREHSCATLDDGSVKCWGKNTQGQLGQGSTANLGDGSGEMGDALPGIDLGTGRTASAVDGGAFGTCALLDGGAVKCWGENSFGRLGLGDESGNRGDQPGEMSDGLPDVDLGTGRSAAALGAGGGHTCVLRDNAAVVCWGHGGHGELGRGDREDIGDEPDEMGDDLRPVRAGTAVPADGIRAIDGEWLHTCAIGHRGTVKCWGANSFGELGLGDTADRGDEPGEMGDALAPVDLGTGRTAIAVAAGQHHTCALLDDRTVKCWGRNAQGELGLGDTTHRGDEPGEMGDALAPVDLGTGRTGVAVAARGLRTCAILDDGTVKCWGWNGHGALGQGSTEVIGDEPGEMGDHLAPVALGTGRTAHSIGLMYYDASCAVLDDGTVRCWGQSDYGALGQEGTESIGDEPGEMGDNLSPVDLGAGRTASAVAAFASGACALLDHGTVKCWGAGGWGNTGQGSTETIGDQPGEMGDDLPAVDLGAGRTATSISAAYWHVCARLDDRTTKCWGRGDLGALGQGTTESIGDEPGEMGDALASVDLGTGRTARIVLAAGYRSCAVLDTGTVKCWGHNNSGELGLGDAERRGDQPGEMGDALAPVDLGT